MKVAVAFDHRGVRLREAVLEAVEASGPRGRSTSASTPTRCASTTRISRGRSATAIRARRGRARRARLRLGRRRLDRGDEDRRDPRCDLPRRVFRAPGRRARRHERALPRLGGRRALARARSSSTPSSARRSSPRGAIWHGWRRSRSWNGSPTAESEDEMGTSRLHELSAHGVSVWMDSLSREMLETGELARLMEEDAVVGVTSNPTIFQKALSTGDLVRRAAARGRRRRRTTRSSSSSRSRRRTSARRAT